MHFRTMCTSCGKVDAPLRKVVKQGKAFQRTDFLDYN